jgi:steroid delta-isomerase-like uncharacterized protein
MADPINIAKRWIEAYNAKDFATLATLMDKDIRVEHHNRGALVNGAENLLAMMREFSTLLPDRRFHSVRRQFASGDTVVTELTWEGTPNADIEGFAKNGETVKLELACLWTVRDGRVADYHDYG